MITHQKIHQPFKNGKKLAPHPKARPSFDAVWREMSGLWARVNTPQMVLIPLSVFEKINMPGLSDCPKHAHYSLLLINSQQLWSLFTSMSVTGGFSHESQNVLQWDLPSFGRNILMHSWRRWSQLQFFSLQVIVHSPHWEEIVLALLQFKLGFAVPSYIQLHQLSATTVTVTVNLCQYPQGCALCFERCFMLCFKKPNFCLNVDVIPDSNSACNITAVL